MKLEALKICGVRRPEDVAPIVAIGATHIGVVLVPSSPRAATVADARRVREAIRASGAAVQLVGVVQDCPIDDVIDLARSIPLDVVQLHGGFAAGAPDALHAALPRVDVIWAAPVDEEGRWSAPSTPSIDHVLLDTKRAGRFGGTGAPFGWDQADRPRGRFFVAGGLTPDNVRDAVWALAPWGLDVSSGVEAAPGIKDAGRLRALAEALQALGWRTSASTPTAEELLLDEISMLAPAHRPDPRAPVSAPAEETE